MSTNWRAGGCSLLPPPGDLDRYVQHLPDAAERLLAAAEREQPHRHQLENRRLAIDAEAVSRSFEAHRRACWTTLVAGLVHLAVMAVAVLEGYGTAATGGAALGMAALAWAIRPPSASGAGSFARTAEQPSDVPRSRADVTEHRNAAANVMVLRSEPRRSAPMPPLTRAALQQIEAAALRTSVADLRAYLSDALGERVAAYLAGAVDDAFDLRLRTGYTVVRMIETCYDSETAKAWLFGTNTRLDGRAPIEVLAQARTTEQLVEVRRAAHAFATAAG